MDITRLHLLLNYYPAVGMVIGLLILLAGFWFRNQRAKKISMKVFIAIALFTFPVYVTGEIAGSVPGVYSGVSAEALDKHRSLARPAFLLIEATGVTAITALMLMGRKTGRDRLALVGVTLFAAAAVTAVIATTHFGRQVKWAGSPPNAVGSSNTQLVDAKVK